MGVYTGTGIWSVEARCAHNVRVARERRIASRYARGPFLEDGEIWIPSPFRDKAFVAEMKRWGLKWDRAKRYWHRPTTKGREQAALDWARRLYLAHFPDHYFWAVQEVSHYFTNLPNEVPEIRELAEVWAERRAE